MKKVLIVGAGFAGVSAALHLSQLKLKTKNLQLKITLVNPTPHFEYHASLYRVLTGHSPLEVCIPLQEIFKGKEVEVLEDKITEIDFQKSIAVGTSQSKYSYDYLVLALGSETAFYGIEGLKKSSFTLKSITDAVRLNHHLHQSFLECAYAKNKADKVCNTHIVIVGGGATGVEVAGELAGFTKKLAKKHFIEPSLITIDLISSSTRLVPNLPQKISSKIEARLAQLDVNVYLNKRVMKEDIETIYLKDIEMKTKTVIWAAGTSGNHRYKEWGLPVDGKGKVKVDEHLKTSFDGVYVIGDGAATPHSGMAKTAWYDGIYIGDSIGTILAGKKPKIYIPSALWHFLPVGHKWVVAILAGIPVYGRLGWYVRRTIDFLFFTQILSFGKAIDAFRSDKILWETCPICSKK